MTYAVMVLSFSLSMYTIARHSRKRSTEVNPTQNDTVLCSLDGPDCYEKCTEDDDGGTFTTYRKAAKITLWLVFDPGNPDALDCSEGPSRLVAQLIWFLYNLVAAVTLMNLLIALMSAGIRELLHLDFFVSLIKEMLNNVFLPPIVKEHSTFHTQKLCTA